MNDLAAELAELRSHVTPRSETGRRHSRAEPNMSDPGGEDAAGVASLAPEKLEELVASLRAVLDQPVEDLEEAIASHPLGSAAAAFFLGVLVGRLLPRA